MFNDRDIAVIGIGAFASVLCLLIPVAFPWKIGIGFSVLAAALVAALIRLGRDRLTLEEFIFRRVRWWLRPKLWTFRMRDLPKPPGRRPPPAPAAMEDAEMPDPPAASAAPPAGLRITWQLDSLKAERAASLLTVVAGVYFMCWLWAEGAVVLGADLAWFLP